MKDEPDQDPSPANSGIKREPSDELVEIGPDEKPPAPKRKAAAPKGGTRPKRQRRYVRRGKWSADEIGLLWDQVGAVLMNIDWKAVAAGVPGRGETQCKQAWDDYVLPAILSAVDELDPEAEEEGW